jgi:Kdo2-lipid IVA lauroyltransferase/acyltransferase
MTVAAVSEHFTERLKAHLLFALTWLAGRLPRRWLRALGTRLGARSARRNSRDFRVTLRNLELTGTGATPGQREALAEAILRHTWATLLETLWVWGRSPEQALALVGDVHGLAHYQDARAGGRGLMVATPHYGNWELLALYLASLEPLAVLYRPPDSRAGDLYMHRVRSAPGVTPVRADANGVRQLVKRLRGGGVVGILPDQQPKAGEGEFATFFGQPALTMTLYSKLAARTGAAMVVAFTERQPDGRYAVHLRPMPEAVAGDGPAALDALNRAIQDIASRDPSQYQWTYKRFKIRPPGSTPDNPYWPDCYGRAAPPRAG